VAESRPPESMGNTVVARLSRLLLSRGVWRSNLVLAVQGADWLALEGCCSAIAAVRIVFRALCVGVQGKAKGRPGSVERPVSAWLGRLPERCSSLQSVERRSQAAQRRHVLTSTCPGFFELVQRDRCAGTLSVELVPLAVRRLLNLHQRGPVSRPRESRVALGHPDRKTRAAR